MSNMIRSIARNRAKQNMKNNGLTKICKGNWFANNWRDWVITRRKEK